MTKEQMKQTLQERKEQILMSLKQNKTKSIAVITALSIMATGSIFGIMACQKNNNIIPTPTETTIETSIIETTTKAEATPTPEPTPIPTPKVTEPEKIEREGLLAEFSVMNLANEVLYSNLGILLFELNGEKKILFIDVYSKFSEEKQREIAIFQEVFSENRIFRRDVGDTSLEKSNYFEPFDFFENENIDNVYTTSFRGYCNENDLRDKYDKIEPTIKTYYDLAKLYVSGVFFDESMLLILPHRLEGYIDENDPDYLFNEERLQKLLREEQEAKTKVKR